MLDKQRFDRRACEVITLVQGEIDGSNEFPSFFYDPRKPRLRKVKKRAISGIAREALENRRKVHSTLLINTNGGLCEDRERLEAKLAPLGKTGRSRCFSTDNARSNGGQLLADSHQRILRTDTHVMWHQTYGDDEDTPYYPPQEFRRWMLDWLIDNTPSLRCFEEAYHRVKAVFVDPELPLDDVRFTGRELHELGCVDQIARNNRALWNVFRNTMAWEYDRWPSEIREFFDC